MKPYLDDFINHQKPTIVVVSNGITPYGVHFLKRISAELHEYNLRTVYSYEFSMGRWTIDLPELINAVVIGKGEEAVGQRGISAMRNGWTRSREIIREIKTVGPVAVMILGYGNISHFLVVEWCKRACIPCLMWGDSNIRCDSSKGVKAFIKKIVVSRAVSRCSALLPCGTLGAKYFQKYGARHEQIFYVPNEPDYSLIEMIERDYVTQVRNEYLLREDKSHIIYSGRLVAVKRVDLLIEAFIRIADNRQNWNLIVAGSGPLEDELKAKIPIWLQERVIWTGFVDSPRKMAALYKISDALVLPSDYEPWALVVNEAACAGLALVCSDIVGAAYELLQDGINGRFFKKSNVDSLEFALMDVTSMDKIENYKIESSRILQKWRSAADPVNGLRRALNYSLDKVL